MKTSVSVQTQATSSEAGVLRLLPHIKRQTSSICKKFLWHFLCYPHDSDETNWRALFCGLIMPVSVIERPLEPPCMSERDIFKVRPSRSAATASLQITLLWSVQTKGTTSVWNLSKAECRQKKQLQFRVKPCTRFIDNISITVCYCLFCLKKGGLWKFYGTKK